MPVGNPAWKKGVSGNPAGKPKGAMSKGSGDIVARILDVWDELEQNNNTRLMTLAKENPQWFYKYFISKIIPRNIDVSLFAGAQRENKLSDSDLIDIIKNGHGNNGGNGSRPLKKIGSGTTHPKK